MDGGPSRVLDGDGNLGQREPVPLDEVEQLDVEGEPVDPGLGEQQAGHVGAERLEPALGVAVLAEQHGMREQVDDPAADLPQAARPDERGGLGVLATADHDVPTRPRRRVTRLINCAGV